MPMENRKKTPASNYLLFFILILVVAAAAVLLLPIYREYQKKQHELSELSERLNERKEERAVLNTDVAALQNSPEAVEKVAREKFDLVRDGETVMKYQLPEKNK